MTQKYDRAFFKQFTFRPFTKEDYYGFSGVESPVPLIADNGEFLVILDGIYAEIYDAEAIQNMTEPYQIMDVRTLK
jgi:hypothetical protein